MGTGFPGPNGMSSMNRAVAPKRQANRARFPTSSSFSPRTTTTFSFTDANPARNAASIPETIRSSVAARPEIRWSFCGSSVSSETLRRDTPASRRRSACVASRWPFVVSAISSMPGVAATSRTMSRRSLAERRLAAGEPDAPDAEPREDADEARELGARERVLAAGPAPSARSSCSGSCSDR